MAQYARADGPPILVGEVAPYGLHAAHDFGLIARRVVQRGAERNLGEIILAIETLRREVGVVRFDGGDYAAERAVCCRVAADEVDSAIEGGMGLCVFVRSDAGNEEVSIAERALHQLGARHGVGAHALATQVVLMPAEIFQPVGLLHVPLSEVAVAISGRCQMLGEEGKATRGQADPLWTLRVGAVPDAVGGGVESGHEGGAGRRADGVGRVAAAKTRAAGGERVQMGRLIGAARREGSRRRLVKQNQKYVGTIPGIAVVRHRTASPLLASCFLASTTYLLVAISPHTGPH